MGVSDSGQDQASLDSIPLVTVALPVYNAGKYLRPAVFSIINQTFKNWELLLIDACKLLNRTVCRAIVYEQ